MFNAGSAGSTVKGLAMYGGSGAAVDIGDNNVQVFGDFLGVQADGTTGPGNATGVSVRAVAAGAVIGTPVPADRNLISLNTSSDFSPGIAIAGTNALVQGNLIGTDSTGSTGLGNQVGVIVNGSNNTIGGRVATARNVISGNNREGILFQFAQSNTVQGNYIGTTADGTVALGNGLSGINLLSSANNTIGGSSLAARNIISGNKTEGVTIVGSSNVVQGNYIGTDVTGMNPLANLINGVELEGRREQQHHRRDGARGGCNVISGNRGVGVRIGSRNNVVQGNYIGTDFIGNTFQGGNNNAVGVLMDSGEDFSTIGGTADGGATSSRAT